MKMIIHLQQRRYFRLLQRIFLRLYIGIWMDKPSKLSPVAVLLICIGGVPSPTPTILTEVTRDFLHYILANAIQICP
jgi:hypothetical protein